MICSRYSSSTTRADNVYVYVPLGVVVCCYFSASTSCNLLSCPLSEGRPAGGVMESRTCGRSVSQSDSSVKCPHFPSTNYKRISHPFIHPDSVLISVIPHPSSSQHHHHSHHRLCSVPASSASLSSSSAAATSSHHYHSAGV